MSLHFTFESAETQCVCVCVCVCVCMYVCMYVLGSSFSDTAYYRHDFVLHF